MNVNVSVHQMRIWGKGIKFKITLPFLGEKAGAGSCVCDGLIKINYNNESVITICRTSAPFLSTK